MKYLFKVLFFITQKSYIAIFCLPKYECTLSKKDGFTHITLLILVNDIDTVDSRYKMK